jgi:tetratricopeptide (TPR) repeat protein
MNNDAEKIVQLKEIVQNQDLTRIFEVVSLALAINDEEDRDLYLLDAIHWLIKNGIWQKAFGAAQLMSETYEKSEALRSIADYLVSIGHLEKALLVYNDAEKTALSADLAEWQKAELLHNLAKSLNQAKAIFKADEVWEKAISIAQKGENSILQDSLDSSSVLAEIAEYFAAGQKIEKALNIAQNIQNIGHKEKALQNISAYSQQTKQVA